MSSSLKASITQATALLRNLAEIDNDIRDARGLEGELIRSKLESKEALTDVAAAGQPLDTARKRLADASEGITSLDFRLRGLDKRRESLLKPLEAALVELDKQLPAVAQQLVPEFEQRWNAACGEMRACLEMRAVLETLIGPIDLLPAPAPTLPATEPALDCLPDGLREPVQLLRQLRSAIGTIEAFVRERKTWADRQARDRRPSAIQRSAIYKVRVPLTIGGRELKSGAVVLGLSLGPSGDYYIERASLVRVDA